MLKRVEKLKMLTDCQTFGLLVIFAPLPHCIPMFCPPAPLRGVKKLLIPSNSPPWGGWGVSYWWGLGGLH